jgi:hypothetical protein
LFDPKCRTRIVLEMLEFSHQGPGAGAVWQSCQLGQPPDRQWFTGQKQSGLHAGQFVGSDVHAGSDRLLSSRHGGSGRASPGGTTGTAAGFKAVGWIPATPDTAPITTAELPAKPAG